MRRTTRQVVFDLLDREGDLPATEIAERLGIIRGTACSARDRWKKCRGITIRGPQPSFRKPSAAVSPAKTSAPAEVTLDSLLELATIEQLGGLLLTGVMEALANRDDAIDEKDKEIRELEEELEKRRLDPKLRKDIAKQIYIAIAVSRSGLSPDYFSHLWDNGEGLDEEKESAYNTADQILALKGAKDKGRPLTLVTRGKGELKGRIQKKY